MLFPLLHNVFLVVSVIGNALLSILVYKNNPRSATNRLLGALGIVVSIWVTTMVSSFLTPSSLFLARLTIFFATPMNILFFFFAHTLPKSEFTLKKWVAIGIMTIGIFVMIIALSPLVFSEMKVINNTPAPTPGPGLPLFGLFSLGLNVAMVYVLGRKFIRSVGAERQQMLFVTLGVFLMFGFIVTTIFFPVLFTSNGAFVAFSPFYTFAFLGMIAYAIGKHRLLDLRALVARAAALVILLGFFALVYAFVLLVGFQRIFHIAVGTELFVAGLILTATAMLSFQPAIRVLRTFTNRIFFAHNYDSDVLLARLTKVMADTIDFSELTGRIIAILTVEMQITKAAFLMADRRHIRNVTGAGFPGDIAAFAGLDILFHGLQDYRRPWVAEELTDPNLRDTFRRLDIALAIPITAEGAEIAILIFGPKLSGDIYFERDIRFLQIFASEAGIAIQNAESYAAVKLLNQELEHRVEERTKELKGSQERELAKARDIARLKDEFVFVAAHELRTPVTAIRGFLELVSVAETNFPKDVREHLRAIGTASGHLNQLINDLLEIARSESGTMKIAVERADIIPVITEVLGEMAPIAAERRVTIRTDIADHPPVVMIDVPKMREVVMNLVSNAVKYNREGGMVDVSVFPIEDTLMVEVRDTGFGIPQDQQEKIFKKFFRAHSKGTELVLGTGLGLFITRMIVEKMGGRIMFTSTEGKGTTFAFAVPIAKP